MSSPVQSSCNEENQKRFVGFGNLAKECEWLPHIALWGCQVISLDFLGYKTSGTTGSAASNTEALNCKDRWLYRHFRDGCLVCQHSYDAWHVGPQVRCILGAQQSDSRQQHSLHLVTCLPYFRVNQFQRLILLMQLPRLTNTTTNTFMTLSNCWPLETDQGGGGGGTLTDDWLTEHQGENLASRMEVLLTHDRRYCWSFWSLGFMFFLPLTSSNRTMP